MWYPYQEMKIAYPKMILLFLILTFFIPCRTSPALAAKITDLRFWSAPDHARVVLDLSEAIQYESSSQEDPPQLHLELKGASLHVQKKEIAVNNAFLTRISLKELGKDRVELVLEQKKSLKATIFPLKPYLDKPHRLVIDLVDVVREKKDQEEREKQKESRPKGTKVVVIDPGHGGEDPGAVGSQKTLEKDIVLKIGEKLASLFGQPGEIKAFLTRKGDYFVPLQQRVKMAREYGADLFISLHTDGSFSSQARGTSVYCVSLSGATDQAAKILADKENMSNILGGALLRPASISKDPNLSQILLDMMQNNSMRESFRFAEYLLEGIKPINPLKYPSYRQANFIVLKAPDIPSVLLETAYISNKEDERLLNRADFQEKIARTINTAVRKYFRQ
jgi:N-acetylmuramoyl-L-alanine amidase